jgi:type I restriction enzyme R subunit
VLHRYELKQLTSADVVERLVEIAKQLRGARHRHEQLGLSAEEAAFYDALAGGVEDVKADPELAKIAHELVEGIRSDLTFDWADREATEAKVRAKIKRLLRKHKYQPPKPPASGGGMVGFDYAAQLVFDQAKALYRYWPEIEAGDRLFR